MLGLSHGGNSPWKGGVRHSGSRPWHQSTNPVFLSPASPFSPSWHGSCRHCPQSSTHTPGAPKASPAITVHWFLGLGSGNQGIPSCQWGAHGDEGEGIEVALISKSSKSPHLVPWLLSVPCPQGTAWGQQEQPASAVPAAN